MAPENHGEAGGDGAAATPPKTPMMPVSCGMEEGITAREGRRQPVNQPTQDRHMKTRAWTRRNLQYGFNTSKDDDGRAVGASLVTLARRNAFELIGLRRPRTNPMIIFRVPNGC